MPLFNWIECNKGNLQYVRKPDGKNKRRDVEAWTVIYDAYIQEFGLGKLYDRLLKAMKKKVELQLDYIITGNRFKLTEIEVEKARLESMLSNKGNGMTIEQTLIHLSKWLGSWVNSKNITVREYFNLINEYGKANKSN
jgi:hypothetical protein